MEDVLNDLTKYNAFLEEKTGKLDTQISRYTALANETSIRKDDVSLVKEQIADLNNRSRMLKDKMHDLKSALTDQHKSGEFDELFQRQVLAMASFPEFSKQKHAASSTESTEPDLWLQCNKIVNHVHEWGKLMNTEIPNCNSYIDDAQTFVNDMIFTTTRLCQAHLSTLFHQELSSASLQSGFPLSGSQSQALEEERESVLKEIDWLWEEVIPVSHMCVVAEYLKPILERQKGWAQKDNSRNAVVATYASEVLEYMNQRLALVSERTRDIVYHQQALANGCKHLKAKTETSSPELHPSTPHGTKRGHQDIQATENLRSFMEVYGIPLDLTDPMSETTTIILEEYVRKREQKREMIHQDIQRALEKAARTSLTDHERSKELLLECLRQDFSESQSQDVFHDAVLEESIDALRKQANQVSDIFRDLQLGGPASAPEFIAHTHSQIIKQLASGNRGMAQQGEGKYDSTLSFVQGPEFDDFVKKWEGCH
ncbi:hypothetical protein F5Y16DRAFT_292233 [Xylariaceae sp. FL0255]|nr:hypothetical protein F5Y16DRAFT_292233 [Xylariaceae sp. FL0255]